MEKISFKWNFLAKNFGIYAQTFYICAEKKLSTKVKSDSERGKIRVFTSTQAREFGENAWHFSEDTEPEVNKGV